MLLPVEYAIDSAISRNFGPDSGHSQSNYCQADNAMNILMLSVTFPYPPSRGGTEVRTYNLLKALQEQHQVTLMTLRHEQVNDEEVAELQNQVETLQVFPSPSENYSRSLVAKTFGLADFYLMAGLRAPAFDKLMKFSIG